MQDNVFSDVKMSLLVEIARSTDDVTTRNHVFLLLSSITKVYSGWISEHIIDIFAVIGESALKQVGSIFYRLDVSLIIRTTSFYTVIRNNNGSFQEVFHRLCSELKWVINVVAFYVMLAYCIVWLAQNFLFVS